MPSGAVERPDKEAVAVAVSELNRCPYCVDAHSAMLRSTGTPAPPPLQDWAAATRTPGAAIVRNPPFSAPHVPELVGTAVLFHYINRAGQRLPGRLAAAHPPPAAAWPDAGAGGPALQRRSPACGRAPGETLDLLPEAELPADLEWARGAPHIAGAWARFTAAAETGG